MCGILIVFIWVSFVIGWWSSGEFFGYYVVDVVYVVEVLWYDGFVVVWCEEW